MPQFRCHFLAVAWNQVLNRPERDGFCCRNQFRNYFFAQFPLFQQRMAVPDLNMPRKLLDKDVIADISAFAINQYANRRRRQESIRMQTSRSDALENKDGFKIKSRCLLIRPNSKTAVSLFRS